VNSRTSAVPEAQPSGAAKSAGIRGAEGVTGRRITAVAKSAASDTFATTLTLTFPCKR
jgi:hypothetical protein